MRVTETDASDEVLRRPVRVLDLPIAAWTDSNVVIVFKAPVHIARFKYGAEGGLSISARERRRGIDIDAVGVTVEAPGDLVAAFTRRRVRLLPTNSQALREVVGKATAEEAARIRTETSQARGKAQRHFVAFGVLWTALLATRFALGGEGEDIPVATVVGLVGSSLAWAVLVTVAVATFHPGDGDSRRVRDRASGWSALAFLAGMVALVTVPIVVAGWLASHLGTPRLLAYGLVAGVPGGMVIGMGIRSIRRHPTR